MSNILVDSKNRSSTLLTSKKFESAEAKRRPNDVKLETDVRAALSWEPGLGNSSISVTANNGAISMHGSVETPMNKFAAIDAARRVRGVISVDAPLSVLLPSSKRSADQSILEAATATLDWDACLAPHRIAAAVDRGWVTVSGEASRQYQKETAEQDVARLNGVLGVTNRITVTATVNVIGITDSIMRALHRTWSFDPKTVQVTAEGGAVCITGEVKSPHEKDLVVAAAWAGPGVVSVKDEMTIA